MLTPPMQLVVWHRFERMNSFSCTVYRPRCAYFSSIVGSNAVRKRGDEWETPNATENDDGGLSAPLMYASLVVGMITVWKKDRRIVEGAEGGEGGEGKVSAEEAVWDDRVSENVTLDVLGSAVKRRVLTCPYCSVIILMRRRRRGLIRCKCCGFPKSRARMYCALSFRLMPPHESICSGCVSLFGSYWSDDRWRMASIRVLIDATGTSG